MQLRELFKKDNNTAVLAFGRMNPITIGHNKLAETIKSIPGDGYIFLSHKQNSKTDPLNFETKLKFAKECFPGITVGDSSVRTIIEAIKKVNSLGYTELVYVAGADRVDEFTKLLNAYNNKEYSFESITVVNAGQRDPDAEGVEGISASKLREAAVNNDVDTFLAGTPSNKFSLEMFNAVRNSMVENNNLKKNDLMSAFEKFFPIAMKVLDIDKLPKIKLEKYLDHLDQPSFGRFANKEVTIHLGVKDRHPIDILRTLAHELVHFKQLLNNELDKDSGNTGSPEENKAHITAGVIMRMFNKKYPEFFKSSVIESDVYRSTDLGVSPTYKDNLNRRIDLSKDAKIDLKNAILTLTPKEQEIIKMRFYHDMEWHEIAKELNVGRDWLYILRSKIARKLRKAGAVESVAENFAANSMAAKDMITYLKKHHDTNLHQDYLDHINTFSQFVLKDIPLNTIKTELPMLDRAKVDQYKKMDFSKAPPIVMGDGYILDGYHRANVAKALGIKSIKAYVGVKDVDENFADGKNPGRKGLSKRMGVNTKASVSSLRKTAKNSSGEKQRMAHWLANMKAGRKKAAKK